MIIELGLIIICEVIILLGILIVYCADYTNSYIHCHKPTEPCYNKTEVITCHCPKKDKFKELFEDD